MNTLDKLTVAEVVLNRVRASHDLGLSRKLAEAYFSSSLAEALRLARFERPTASTEPNEGVPWRPMAIDGTYLLPFGKYRGMMLSDVLRKFSDYARWLCEQDWFNEGRYKPIAKFLRGELNLPREFIPKPKEEEPLPF